MQNQIIDTANKANEAAYAAAKEVAALNSATLETFFEKQLEVIGQTVELGVRQMKLAADNKTANAAFKAQVELVEDAAGQVLDNVRDMAAIASKARSAYDKLVDKNVKDAVGQLKAKKSA